MQRESDLYPFLKAHFEAEGLIVKSEIGAADLVAMCEDRIVIVEMKLKFSLSLYHQGLERQLVSPCVYLAVQRPEGAKARRMLAQNKVMCARLGLGLITVRGRDGHVEVLTDPAGPGRRLSKPKVARLKAEFSRRQGDPNTGGATRHGIVTGYRQDALRIATYLAEYGASKGAAVARDIGVPGATRILSDNHYGWFTRIRPGHYALAEAGRKGLADWDGALPGQ